MRGPIHIRNDHGRFAAKHRYSILPRELFTIPFPETAVIQASIVRRESDVIQVDSVVMQNDAETSVAKFRDGERRHPLGASRNESKMFIGLRDGRQLHIA
jgi:hypothetical protein